MLNTVVYLGCNAIQCINILFEIENWLENNDDLDFSMSENSEHEM